MAWTTQTKMVIGYDNKVRPDLVSSVAVTNFTANANFPADNLKYDDPWRIMKASSVTNHALITFTFSSSQTFDCCGFINHNFLSQGYEELDINYMSGTWTGVGPSVLSFGSVPGDPNFRVRFTSQSSTQWRVHLRKTSAWPDFYLGAVFFGTLYEVGTNPTTRLMQSRLEVPLLIEEAAGSARHVVRQAAKFTHDAEITFTRAANTQVQTLSETIARNNTGRLLAVVQPDQSASSMPLSTEHFFGYINALNIAPRMGLTSTTHKADIVMRLQGAV